MHALLHTVGVLAGCAVSLAPVLLPSVRSARRWPYIVMALGMAVGHLGGWFLWAAVLALLTAGWLCGSPIRRAETGHHIQDFVFMPILMMLTASGGPALTGSLSGHAHGGGSMTTVALAISLTWTCAGLIRVLPVREADRKRFGQDVCSAGMAADMTFMAALAL